MEAYWVSCKKNTADENFRGTKQSRLMIVSNCAFCDKKRNWDSSKIKRLLD